MFKKFLSIQNYRRTREVLITKILFYETWTLKDNEEWWLFFITASSINPNIYIPKHKTSDNFLNDNFKRKQTNNKMYSDYREFIPVSSICWRWNRFYRITLNMIDSFLLFQIKFAVWNKYEMRENLSSRNVKLNSARKKTSQDFFLFFFVEYLLYLNSC